MRLVFTVSLRSNLCFIIGVILVFCFRLKVSLICVIIIRGTSNKNGICLFLLLCCKFVFFVKLWCKGLRYVSLIAPHHWTQHVELMFVTLMNAHQWCGIKAWVFCTLCRASKRERCTISVKPSDPIFTGMYLQSPPVSSNKNYFKITGFLLQIQNKILSYLLQWK